MTPAAAAPPPRACKALLEAIPADGRPVMSEAVIQAAVKAGFADRVARASFLQLAVNGLVRVWCEAGSTRQLCRRRIAR